LFPTLESGPLKLSLLREGDWLGIATMAIGLASLQTVLDEGNKDGWFDSPLILHLTIISAVFLVAFILIELNVKSPLIRLRLLTRRNFGLGTVANVMVGFALFGSVYVLPTYLGEVQGYDAEQVGLVLAWVGLPQLLIIPFVPLLVKRLDPRILVCIGLGVFSASCFMNTHLSLDVSGPQLITSNLVRALGQAIVLSPLTGIAMSGIGKDGSAAASGIFNMMRSLGGAVGTAILATIITRREQFHSNIIGQSVTASAPAVKEELHSMQQYFMSRGVTDPALAFHQAEVMLGNLVHQQSLIIAFSETFAVLGMVLLIAALAVMFTRRAA